MTQPSAIVIGAGIVGLATARALAVRGYSVTVFERNERAVGASIRNFGMIWPIGQATGPMYERAMLSRSIWKAICTEANIWHDEVGSLHLAYHDDELLAVKEYVEANQQHRDCALLNADQALEKSPAVNMHGLKGALWSGDEMIIESRVAVGQVAAYLAERYKVKFHWKTAISRVEHPTVYSGNEQWSADEIFVCSGIDLETLYPQLPLPFVLMAAKHWLNWQRLQAVRPFSKSLSCYPCTIYFFRQTVFCCRCIVRIGQKTGSCHYRQVR